MCNPTAILMAVQTAAATSAKNQQMESQQEAALAQQKQMNMQRVAEMEDTNRKAALELTENKRESLRQQASARVATAESGAAGATPLRNLMNVYMQESINSGTVISKNEAANVMTGIAAQGDFVSTRNAINTAESQKTTGMAAALQIGMSAAAGYGSGGGFEKGATLKGQWAKTTDLFGLSSAPVDLNAIARRG